MSVAAAVMKKRKREGESVKEPDPAPASTPAPAPARADAPDYSIVVGLRKSKLPDIARRLAELDELADALEKERKSLKSEGAEILQRAGAKCVMVGDLRVTRVDGSSPHLSKTRLLELGVSEKVIEKATTITPYTTLKVTPPKVRE